MAFAAREWGERLLQVRARKLLAVVGDAEHERLLDEGCIELDPRLTRLHGVQQQVEDDLAHRCRRQGEILPNAVRPLERQVLPPCLGRDQEPEVLDIGNRQGPRPGLRLDEQGGERLANLLEPALEQAHRPVDKAGVPPEIAQGVQHSCERVVDLVRDPGSHATDRGESIGGDELPLQLGLLVQLRLQAGERVLETRDLAARLAVRDALRERGDCRRRCRAPEALRPADRARR